VPNKNCLSNFDCENVLKMCFLIWSQHVQQAGSFSRFRHQRGYFRKEELTVVPVVLCACLGWKGQGYIFTAGFSNDDLLLVNSVGSINKLGNIEALVLNLVLALNLSDLNSLGDADLLGGRVGEHAGDLKGGSDKGDLVGLSLVFLTAHLVFSLAISLLMAISVSSSSTSSHLHSLRLLIISDLGGGARGDNLFLLIHIGADLSLNDGGCFLADGEDTVKAVVIVYDLLDCKSDWGHLLSKGGHTDLSIDRGVGIPAVVLRGIAISRGVHGCRGTSDQSRNK